MSIFSLRGNGNVEFIDISDESVPMLVQLSAIFEKLSGVHIAIYKEEESIKTYTDCYKKENRV